MPLFQTLLAALMLHPAGDLPVSDVPSGHWAAAAVRDVINRGIMTAPGGKFDGERAVTRRELTIALAQFAKSLLAKKWTAAASTKPGPDTGKAVRKTVTRYELAAALTKIAPNIVVALPPPGSKPIYESDVFPHSAKVKAPATDPAYGAAQYLAKEHMAFADSVALAPGPARITAIEARKAIGQMLEGLVDRLTAEPQNREEIAPPPRRK